MSRLFLNSLEQVQIGDLQRMSDCITAEERSESVEAARRPATGVDRARIGDGRPGCPWPCRELMGSQFLGVGHPRQSTRWRTGLRLRPGSGRPGCAGRSGVPVAARCPRPGASRRSASWDPSRSSLQHGAGPSSGGTRRVPPACYSLSKRRVPTRPRRRRVGGSPRRPAVDPSPVQAGRTEPASSGPEEHRASGHDGTQGPPLSAVTVALPSGAAVLVSYGTTLSAEQEETDRMCSTSTRTSGQAAPTGRTSKLDVYPALLLVMAAVRSGWPCRADAERVGSRGGHGQDAVGSVCGTVRLSWSLAGRARGGTILWRVHRQSRHAGRVDGAVSEPGHGA